MKSATPIIARTATSAALACGRKRRARRAKSFTRGPSRRGRGRRPPSGRARPAVRGPPARGRGGAGPRQRSRRFGEESLHLGGDPLRRGGSLDQLGDRLRAVARVREDVRHRHVRHLHEELAEEVADRGDPVDDDHRDSGEETLHGRRPRGHDEDVRRGEERQVRPRDDRPARESVARELAEQALGDGVGPTRTTSRSFRRAVRSATASRRSGRSFRISPVAGAGHQDDAAAALRRRGRGRRELARRLVDEGVSHPRHALAEAPRVVPALLEPEEGQDAAPQARERLRPPASPRPDLGRDVEDDGNPGLREPPREGQVEVGRVDQDGGVDALLRPRPSSARGSAVARSGSSRGPPPRR